MFEFDDYEDLSDYTFTYPVEQVLNSQYKMCLRKHKEKKIFEEFVIPFVKERIMYGYSRFRELEPEWEKLKYYIDEVEKESSIEKAHILYDQVLQLFYEGFPLPANLKNNF